MSSVGNPSADSRRVAITSAKISGLFAPYFTFTLSPSGSVQSNFGVFPEAGSGSNRQWTT
jgi:hypothetical protein